MTNSRLVVRTEKAEIKDTVTSSYSRVALTGQINVMVPVLFTLATK